MSKKRTITGRNSRLREYRLPKKVDVDNETHHLLTIITPPEGVILLRQELIHHPDILEKANKANIFEEALGTIAAELSIALDGVYDPNDLCTMLYNALCNRKSNNLFPEKRARGLVAAEIVETKGEIKLESENMLDRILSTQMKLNRENDRRKTVLDDLTGEEKLPPYIICNECSSWFECCENRICKLGKRR
jgi:hypothetical protein